MDVYQRMKDTIAGHEILSSRNAVLLMVSGGSDSTALAHLAARMREEGEIGAVAMLHFNHKLRGADADADAVFVAQLAESLGIPFFMCEMDIGAEAARSGENVEALARHERYVAAHEALSSMCEHEGYAFADGRIATAHTADDRIENFYMRSIVGTGPGGFRSLDYVHDNVVRPLLDCTREELREYLKSHAGHLQELWREDATNADTDRFRAYVRHEIVPKARAWNSSLERTLVRTMNLIAEEDDMLDAMASETISVHVVMLGDDEADGFCLRPSFGAVPRPLGRRVIHRLLKPILGMEERIDTSTVEAVLEGFSEGRPKSGYVTNIQGNLAVSANKQGVRVEPMAAFRKRRKK